MDNKRPTQCKKIVDYIKKFGSITQYDAFFDLGVMRLASRISELKKDGYEFDKDWQQAKNRYGEDVRFLRYKFKKEDKQI